MLSTPPAFILSQDQTLNKNVWIQFRINILANSSLLLFYKVSSLNACFRKTKFSGRYSSFLESFKVVSLFNYQGSLLLFSSAATFILYHCFLSLSTTFLSIFQSFDWSFVFLTVSLRQLYYIIIRTSICQQFFSFFYKIPHSGISSGFQMRDFNLSIQS